MFDSGFGEYHRVEIPSVQLAKERREIADSLTVVRASETTRIKSMDINDSGESNWNLHLSLETSKTVQLQIEVKDMHPQVNVGYTPVSGRLSNQRKCTDKTLFILYISNRQSNQSHSKG